MDTSEFTNHFGSSGPVVLPVIHVLDNLQACSNIAIAKDAGCPGVFLINHDFDRQQFLPIIKHAREQFPDFWIGVNFLAVTGKIAFPILAELGNNGTRVDAYWADDARIDESRPAEDQPEATEILQIKNSCGWNGMYFGGTAFKKQREVHPDNYEKSAFIATGYMDVVTTSGIATGHSADHAKMQTFREACKEKPLALASGVTPENITDYSAWANAVLVATGINVKNDFYNIDSKRLRKLLNNIEEQAQSR